MIDILDLKAGRNVKKLWGRLFGQEKNLTTSGIYLVGLLILPFAPETKGKSLPE